jgi:hypothetical protein
MDSREENAHKVHDAASEIATVLGANLMNLLPGITSKYAINSPSFIVAAVQAAVKVAASGTASVTHMEYRDSLAMQRDLNAVIHEAISSQLPHLREEHNQIWQVASDEGRNSALLIELSKTFSRIEETLGDYGPMQDE